MDWKRFTRGNWPYYILAVSITAVWGSTFAATKILMNGGMSPMGIFTIRFLMAWVVMLLLFHRRLWAQSLADELKLMLAGVLGGSLYYWLQNWALALSQTTNVSFLLSFCPLITILLAVAFFKDQRITRRHLVGLAIAIVGTALVIFSGQRELHIAPAGDILALTAATTWGFYTQLIRPMTGRYEGTFMTRKVFFYGTLTSLPIFFTGPWQSDVDKFASQPEVALSILYLTILASIFCYLAFNAIIRKLGPVRAASFLYLDPVFSTIFSFIFMDEIMTPTLASGLALILCGVIIAQRAKG